MPSSYSTNLRFELQFTGENINLWGDKLDNTFSRIDDAIAGLTIIALTGNRTLTSTNSNTAADEARAAILKFTGTGAFTVTIPSLTKKYTIWNACTGILTITTGSGTTVAVQPSEVASVICDAANVKRAQGTEFGSQQLTGLADPTSAQMAATKAYVDGVAFTANAGILPGQTGANGFFLKSNGTTALWQQLTSANLSDTATRDAAALGQSVALAVSL